MKRIMLILFFVTIAFAGCKKDGPSQEDTRASIIGKWKFLFSKIDYYDNSNAIVYTDNSDESTIIEFDEVNCRIGDVRENYTIVSTGGKTYLTFSGDKISDLNKIEIIQLNKSNMKWLSEETDVPYSDANDVDRVAPKAVLNATFLKQ